MPSLAVDAQEVRRWRDLLLAAAHEGVVVGDGVGADADRARVDLIGELEMLKSIACAIQADLCVALDHSTRAREATVGIPAARRGRGVAGQIGLARHVSPHRARMLLGLAHDLHTDLPHTRTAMLNGHLNEYGATLVSSETGCLQAEDRALIDQAVCGNPTLLHGLSTGQLIGELRRRTNAADPASVVRRNRKAVTERRVSIRPTPDTMTYLTGLLPLTQGIAAFAALTRDADALRAAGDPRTKGQLMADLLVERLTGQTTADAVPVCIDLVISDETLLAAGHEPAQVPGHGTIPAQIARELIAHALDNQIPTWLRRIYADPTGQLVAMTSKRRFATDSLTTYIALRDAGICRTPWCDAPIRHIDHITTMADGGQTTATNTQGLCEQCNHTKQAPGWTQQVIPGPRHTVQTTTPTGHRHRSQAPAPPTPARRPPRRPIPMEIYVSNVRLELALA